MSFAFIPKVKAIEGTNNILVSNVTTDLFAFRKSDGQFLIKAGVDTDNNPLTV